MRVVRSAGDSAGCARALAYLPGTHVLFIWLWLRVWPERRWRYDRRPGAT